LTKQIRFMVGLYFFVASSCAAPLRVCTECMQGGPTTLAALVFLAPRDGPSIVGCGCIARCDRGVAVRLPSGEIEEGVTGAAACAATLRRLGYSVDQRLPDAFSAARRGDELVAVSREPEAVLAYNRAFSLAIATGLGLRWRARRSPVSAASKFAGSQIAEPPGASSGDGRIRAAARLATTAQVLWFARLMTKRARVQLTLARQGQVRASRRSLEDALYAVQLAEGVAEGDALSPHPSSAALASLPALGTALADVESGEGPDETSRRASGAVVGGLAGEGADVRLEAWECLAEAFEVARDIEGAIYAYERLLALEPSTTPGLSPTTSAKRGVQELVLLSHRQGLETTLALGRGLQEATDRSVADVVNRGLEDVEALRTVVRHDLDVVEERVRSRSPSRLERLLLGAFQPTAKALDDLQLMRRIAESDLNRLQRTLLLGDPLLAFLRETWQRAQGKAPPPVMLDALPISSEAVLWLREQFERGVLPQDPLLVASLLEQARRDPELVIRLVGEIAAASACTADGEGVPEECGLPGELPDSNQR
jgi:hypothetical protein